MKLPSLTASTPHLSQDAKELARAGGERIRRVEASEGLEGDRERSLQQELAEVEHAALSGLESDEHVRQEARDLAEQLSTLDAGLESLIRPGVRLPDGMGGIDEAV